MKLSETQMLIKINNCDRPPLNDLEGIL